MVDGQLGEQHQDEEANGQDDITDEEERLCVGELQPPTGMLASLCAQKTDSVSSSQGIVDQQQDPEQSPHPRVRPSDKARALRRLLLPPSGRLADDAVHNACAHNYHQQGQAEYAQHLVGGGKAFGLSRIRTPPTWAW